MNLYCQKFGILLLQKKMEYSQQKNENKHGMEKNGKQKQTCDMVGFVSPSFCDFGFLIRWHSW